MKQKRRKQRYGEYVRKSLYPAEMKRLTRLKKALLKLGDLPKNDSKKIILYNVNFFDIISRFQDEGYLYYQPSKKKSISDRFNLYIRETGRQEAPQKWNLTKKGEKVTTQNVIYGGVFGLPMKPASYWLYLPKSQKIILDFRTALAVDFQNSHVMKTEKMWITDALIKATVLPFTKKNLKDILKLIEDLL